LKSKEKKSDFRSSFFDYAIHSSFLRTWRRRPTPSEARGHAQKKIMIIISFLKIVIFFKKCEKNRRKLKKSKIMFGNKRKKCIFAISK